MCNELMPCEGNKTRHTVTRGVTVCTLLCATLLNACSAPPPEPDLSIPSQTEPTRLAIQAMLNREPGHIDIDVHIVGGARNANFVRSNLSDVVDIYQQCDVRLDARINELPDQESSDIALATLYALTHEHAQRRPAVFLIDSTDDRELAFSYLPSFHRDVAATAWISNRVSDACFAWVLAHEIGHIVLDDATHHPSRSNVMHRSCSSGNVGRSEALPRWSEAQCQVLRGG